ncbi:MAG TPA: hypothetical protein DD473_10620 [Planctomycetaceae bacterium]|nr:hypothetical protein [Planctomycetaceae bacterium]
MIKLSLLIVSFLMNSGMLFAQDEVSTPETVGIIARLKDQAYQFEAEGNTLKAIKSMESAERLILSEGLDEELPDVLIFLTTRRIREDQLEAARESALRMYQLDSAKFGKEYWRTRAWESGLKYIDALKKLDDLPRKQVLKADLQLSTVSSLISIGETKVAVDASRSALEVIREHLGEEMTEFSDARGTLGKALYADQQFRKAEPHLRFAIKRYSEIYGPGHPSMTDFIDALSDILGHYSAEEEKAGHLEKALVHQREVIETLLLKGDEWANELIEPRYDFIRLQRLIAPIPPAKEQELFSDNFEENTLKLYQTSTELTWNPGTMTASEVTWLRPVASEISTEMRMNFQISGEVTKGRGYFRWGFKLGQNAAVWIGIHRTMTGDSFKEELWVEESQWDGKQWASGVNRTWHIDTGTASGLWTTRLDQGLLKIEHNQSEVYYTSLYNNSREPVTAILGNAFQLEGDYDSIEVSGIPRRVFTQDEDHVDQAAEYYIRQEAEPLNKGDYLRAFQLRLISYRYRKAIYGEHHVKHADSVKAIGYLLDVRGDPEGALPFFEEGLEINRRQLGELHPDTAALWNNLAYIHQRLGHPKEAIPMYARSVKIMEITRGEIDELTAQSLSNLGNAIGETGDKALAREYFEKSLAIRIQMLGEDAPKTADSYGLMAQSLVEMGDFKSAITYAEKCLKIHLRTQGDQHPEALKARLIFSIVLHHSERNSEAIENCRLVYNAYRESFGSQNEVTRRAGHELNTFLESAVKKSLDEGKFSEVAELISDQLELRTEMYGSEDWKAVNLSNDLMEYQSIAKLPHAKQVQFKNALEQIEKAKQQTDRNQHQLACEFYVAALKALSETIGQETRYYALMNASYGASLSSVDKFEEALQAYSESFSILEPLLGEKHPDYSNIEIQLARLYMTRGELDKAHDYLIQGNKRHNFLEGDLSLIKDLSESWQYAASLLARAYEDAGEWEKALELGRNSISVQKSLYGNSHWKTRDAELALQQTQAMQSLDLEALEEVKLAYQLYKDSNTAEKDLNWKKSKGLRKQAYDLLIRHFGVSDPQTTQLQFQMARCCVALDQDQEAQELFSEVAKFRESSHGSTHPETADAFYMQSHAAMKTGDLRTALVAARTSREIQQFADITKTTRYASTLNSMAIICLEMKDYQEATLLFEESGQLLKITSGVNSQVYALSRSNLASLYKIQKDARATDTLVEAIELVRKAFGEDHPEFAVMLEKAASTQESSENWDKAREYYQKSLEINQRVYGTTHTSTLKAKVGLARILAETGNYDEAIRELKEIVGVIADQYGTNHPDYADHCESVAVRLYAIGNSQEALEYQYQALDARAENFAKTASVQSERQQLLLSSQLLNSLHNLLLFEAGMKTDPTRAYERILAWKGAVLVRQMQRRLAVDNEELQPIVEELQQVTRSLAALESVRDDQETRESRRKERKRLISRREELESQLSIQASQLLSNQEQAISVNDLQQHLPENSVLVDYFVYRGSVATATDDGRRLVAFVVPSAGKIQRIELGKADEIEAVIDEWRREIVRGAGGVRGDLRIGSSTKDSSIRSPQTVLRERVWDPVAKYFGNAETVLIAADTFLTRLPFAALPGTNPDRYLIEELQLVYVPAAQMLSHSVDAKNQGQSTDNSLLLVGDVDFAAPGSRENQPTTDQDYPLIASTRSSNHTLHEFSPLPETADEIDVIKQLYLVTEPVERLSILRGSYATEGELRHQVAGRKYVHFATHGFFRSASQEAMKSDADESIINILPGLQSGLALAGANRSSGFSISQLSAGDDGLLTAIEVAELDLKHTEIAVLSACETGLGKIAGGEGLLGLQRAFHLAGADTVVATLWQVDDEATRVLMVEFYKNLWERKLGRLESLRQAQIAMLRGKLHQVASRNDEIKTNSIPPRFWAAFVLSGEW